MNFIFTVEIVAVLVFLVSFVSTYYLIPKLIDIVHCKNLMDNPDQRSSHIEKTPTLGGSVFFISLIFGLFVIHYFNFNGFSLNVIVGLTILFFIGLKDDLMVLSAKTKLLAEFIAFSFILVLPDFWISNFSGFLGIGEVPVIIGVLFSYIIMITIVNAYNLIDGIDGLAGMFGVLIFLIYGILFYYSGNEFFFLLSILSIGFLIAFLRYNISKTNRIFMGDTGSLIVGFLIAVLTVRFLSLPDQMYQQILINPVHKFLIALTIIFLPITDVSRVIFIRLMAKRNIFEPDRCHMHHALVDTGLSHKKTSVILTISGAIIFGITFYCSTFFDSWALIVILIGFYLLTLNILFLLDYYKNSSSIRKQFNSLYPESFEKKEKFKIINSILFFQLKFLKNLL